MNQKRIARRLKRAGTPPRFTHALLVAIFPKSMGYHGYLAQERISASLQDVNRVEGENK